ncbi:MAG: NYN domain-containing protein [bacterium]|nr:NYN domain-containing protein [bacterium]
MFWKKRKKRVNKIIWVIDIENLIFNAKIGMPPERYSFEEGFNKIIELLTEEIGEIIGIFAFVPTDRALLWGREIDKLGFNIILCPKVKSKQGEDKDTTDDKLIELTEWFIDNVRGITHLCLGSGDKDFSPLLRKAALKGLKRVVVAGDIRSLSSDLIRLTSAKPGGGKMVYLFTPISE